MQHIGLFGYLSGFGAIYIHIHIIQGVGLIRFYKVLVGYHFPKWYDPNPL